MSEQSGDLVRGVDGPGRVRSVPDRRYPFRNAVDGAAVVLVYQERGDRLTWGVEHAGCSTLADVVLDLDAYRCSACQRGGRIDAGWVLDLIEPGAPSRADIELDGDGSLSDGNHDDIAYVAGFLTEDEYEAVGAWGPLIGEEWEDDDA